MHAQVYSCILEADCIGLRKSGSVSKVIFQTFVGKGLINTGLILSECYSDRFLGPFCQFTKLSGINGKIEGLNTEEKDSFTFVRIFLKGIFDLKNILLLKADFSPPKKCILGLGLGCGSKPKSIGITLFACYPVSQKMISALCHITSEY